MTVTTAPSILGTGISEGLLLKPVRYQWAMDLYEQAVANTWFPNEIQLGEDIADFKRMTDEERHAVTFLMSYFNPSELLVNKALAFGVYLTGAGSPARSPASAAAAPTDPVARVRRGEALRSHGRSALGGRPPGVIVEPKTKWSTPTARPAGTRLEPRR